ncbi:DoxX family protein [Maribacter sp. ANRC-HE7]|uniref:DoxX family protein n=1 Tax=Maribacter aquimaris TaxID=2737171 RepID=A0ABR7V259_9FLAO|nr:BT_3928 family protein [Maribacter aquimaris]MBD0778009.1 DoxX family protein [Maribacter aquimaris]
MKYVVGFSRIFVGFLFIFSGFVKLNDPVGFTFKLEEYFSEAVLNLTFLMPYALGFALFVVVFEILLGVMLLLGFRLKFTLWSLFLMIVFFGFLTFYSAYFNKVTDCGCFGDAVNLTPWGSFTKDMVLLVFIIILLVGKKYLKPIFGSGTRRVVTAMALVACALFANHVLRHLPVIDFRPYKIGENIKEGMVMPEDAQEAVFEYAWKFNVDGTEKVIVTHGDYPSVDGEFIDVETTEIVKGYEPPIHDFTIEQNGEDFAPALLEEPKLMMIVSYDLSKSDADAFPKLAETIVKAKDKGYKVIGMSASSPEKSAEWVKKYNLGTSFYFTDETALKTIVRSNPGVLTLEKGTITQKVHHNDLEDLRF